MASFRQPIPEAGKHVLHVDAQEFELGAGEFLFFGPGHAEDIQALENTALLLTIIGGEED